MQLFYLDADHVRLGRRQHRTWLVVAVDESEAISLIPAASEVRDVDISPTVVDGPKRLVGWLGSRLIGA